MMTEYRPRTWLCASLALAIGSTAAAALFEFPAGKRLGTVKGWPPGLVTVLDRENRVHGYGFNDRDYHFYAGDAAALNQFLKDYALLPLATHRLTLVRGEGIAESPGWRQQKKEPRACDWKVAISPGGGVLGGKPNVRSRFDVTVEVYTDGNVDFKTLDLPQNVELDDQRKGPAKPGID